MRPSLGVGASQASLWQQKKPCAGREVLCDSPSEVPIGQIGCASTWELMTKGCSKRSCAERARSSRTFPTTSPSFQSFFLKSSYNHRRTGWTKYVFQLSIDAVAHFALVFLFPFRLPRHQLNIFYCEGCGDGQNRKCHSCPPASMQNSNVC